MLRGTGSVASCFGVALNMRRAKMHIQSKVGFAFLENQRSGVRNAKIKLCQNP